MAVCVALYRSPGQQNSFGDVPHYNFGDVPLNTFLIQHLVPRTKRIKFQEC